MAHPPRRRALYAAPPPTTGSAISPARVDRGVAEALDPARGADASDALDDDAPRRKAPRRARLSSALAWRWLWLTLLMAAAAIYQFAPWRHWVPQRLTQEDIDGAVLYTLNEKPLPSPAAKAYAAVIPSVVRVLGVHDEDDDKTARDAKEVRPPPNKRALPGPPQPGSDEEQQEAKPKAKDGKEGKAPKDEAMPGDDDHTVGTGVVIIDNGTILTNLHVVAGAKKVKVEFADGLTSDADLIALRPEHDLAVLRARKIPDDLQAAAMRSTSDLKPGDRVTAVGFPFGIGPSVSHGVVSGLKRDFRSPKGDKVLTNLIQFDAAANPGNSGGPLVTDDGAVVGIVTAIYNPTAARFFVGLGFAVPIENAAQAAGMPPF